MMRRLHYLHSSCLLSLPSLSILCRATQSSLSALSFFHTTAQSLAVPSNPRPPLSAGGKRSKPSQPSAAPAPSSSSSSSSSPSLLSNESLLLAHRELRVIDDTGVNLGVLASAAGYALAKSRGLDLVLVNEAATPPVARVLSLAVELRARRKAASATRAAQAARKAKEIHLTARTGAHDLGIKAGKVIAFLEAGSPVKVGVAFSKGAGFLGREESARRTVLQAMAERVEASGKGFCDAASISGAGSALTAQFVPVAAPKAQEHWAPVYAKLGMPIRAGEPEAEAGAAQQAPAAASVGGRGAAAAAAAGAAAASARAGGGAAPLGRGGGRPAAAAAAGPWVTMDSSPAAAGAAAAAPASRAALPDAKTLLKRFSEELAPVLEKGKGGGGRKGDEDLEDSSSSLAADADVNDLAGISAKPARGGRVRSARLKPL